MKCSYCNEKSVACTTRAVGEKPARERLEHTQSDVRRVVVVRACPAHADRLLKP
jgi:hypothetical protein